MLNEVASYEARLASIEKSLSVLTWMTAANLAATVSVLFKLLH